MDLENGPGGSFHPRFGVYLDRPRNPRRIAPELVPGFYKHIGGLMGLRRVCPRGVG